MRKISIIILFCLVHYLVSGQLSGVKTIPGDYPTIADAVAALNSQGVGPGGVSFQVTAGHTENTTAPIVVTATGTAANPIEFKKTGAGANPSITRTDAGSINTLILGGDGDAIIRLSGTDYFTWREINLNAGNQGIEYGFMTHKPDGANGSSFLNIRNSVITLTKGTSAFVTGIYISNGPTSASSITGVTVTAASGRNHTITIAGNTVQNVHVGIYCRGSGSALYPDDAIVVGEYNNGNDIKNFGGGNTATVYGIYFSLVSNPEAISNDIDNQAAHAGPFTGIYYTGVKGYVSGSYNTIVINNSATDASAIHGIYCSSVVVSNTFEWNTFAAYPISSTGSFYWIRTSGNTESAYISDNGDFGGLSKASGLTHCIYVSGAGSDDCYDYIGNNTFGNITVNGGSSSFYGIYYNITGTASHYTEIDGNYFSPMINNGSGTTYGIYSQNAGHQQTVSGNTISGVTGGADVTGIYVTGLTPLVYSNIVNNMTSAGTAVTGIDGTGTGTSHIYRNNIYNLTSTNSAPLVKGINVFTQYFSHIYNNYISDLRSPNANKNVALAGIYFNVGMTANVFHNTIFLNATSSGALFGSAGIYEANSQVLDLRNNNIVNISTPNGALGYTTAYQSEQNLQYEPLSESSNCNNLYAGTPGPNRLIYRFNNFHLIQTLHDYKNLASPSEGASISENPPFINAVTPPYNLHLQTNVPTQCEKGGRPVTTPIQVSFDFDGNTRNANFPDIGADEFSGIASDQMPPAISLIPLQNTASTGNRTLQTTFTDPSGVPTSGSGLPMLYWRVNAGAYTGVQATYVSGNRYDFTFGAGVSINNVVEYYIVANDQSATPKIGSQPYGGSGFSANPPACSTPPANPYSYTIKQGISGIVYVGNGYFTSLTGYFGLFEAINNRVVTGDITAIINSDLDEDGTIELYEWLEDGAGNYTLTIKPDGPVNRNITGDDIYGRMIMLWGADRVVFDGRYNGSGRYLSFINISTDPTTSVFNLISDGLGAGCTDITIRNCNISGTPYDFTENYGILSNTYEDQDNISIIDNFITRCYHGIYFAGGAPYGLNDNLLISGNTIGAESGPTVNYRAITILNATDPVISDNEIVNIRIYAAQANAGIEVKNYVTGALITGNRIHKLRSIENGGRGTYGIYITGNTSVDNITISNNLIYDLITDGGGSSTSNNPFGIRILGGSGHKIYHNSVHMGGSFLNLSGNHVSAALFILNNPAGLDIRNNILSNTMTGAAGVLSYSVYASSTTFGTIDRNNYFGSPLAYNGSAVNTLVDWQAYTGQDGNSIAADPLFSSADLQLTNPLSPAIGNASPVSVTTDISGNARHPVHPAMGAREYNPTNSWIGNSAAWNSASNWGRNLVPDNSYQVIIPTAPAGGNFPLVPSGVFECHSLHMDAGSSLDIQGQLEVKNIQP